MKKEFAIDPKLDIVLERFIDAPRQLVWDALTKPEHVKEWYMPRQWGRVERLVWTSMLFPGYRPAVFDDIPITAIITMKSEGTGTRYTFTALHRSEADLENDKASGWLEGTNIALDQLVEHVRGMK